MIVVMYDGRVAASGAPADDHEQEVVDERLERQDRPAPTAHRASVLDCEPSISALASSAMNVRRASTPWHVLGEVGQRERIRLEDLDDVAVLALPPAGRSWMLIRTNVGAARSADLDVRRLARSYGHGSCEPRPRS